MGSAIDAPIINVIRYLELFHTVHLHRAILMEPELDWSWTCLSRNLRFEISKTLPAPSADVP